MHGRSQNDYSNTELDQELLTLPFKVNTNWYVITGAPCSGKTTLIDQLADLGYNTVPEAGRKYIENELAKGRSLDEVRQAVRDEFMSYRRREVDELFYNQLKEGYEIIIEEPAVPAETPNATAGIDRWPHRRDAGRVADQLLTLGSGGRYRAGPAAERVAHPCLSSGQCPAAGTDPAGDQISPREDARCRALGARAAGSALPG